jgi:hypothetical protein
VTNIALPTTRVSPEYILRVLADEHRQQVCFDPEADDAAVLGLSTTIAEWRDACDLLSWRALGRALNEHWQINVSETEWRSVLEPSRRRTLLGVCQLIAARAELPQLVPRGYLGARCTSAAAFQGIRAELAAAGCDTSKLRPSTKLESYLCEATEVFLKFSARTAPGVLPPIRIEVPLVNRLVLIFLVGWIALTTAAGIANWRLFISLSIVLAIVLLVIFVWSHTVGLRRVTFGSLETFADFARCLASRPEGQRSLDSQTTPNLPG